MVKLSFIVLLLLFGLAQAQARPHTTSRAHVQTRLREQTNGLITNFACEKINAIYSACGRAFDFDGRDFHFVTALGARTVPCDDGKTLGFYDRLEQLDLASTLSIPYEPGAIALPEIRQNNDPGRLRSEDLFASVYGGTAREVQERLIPVSFLGQTVKFQKNLGAAAALARVNEALLAAASTDGELAKFLVPFTSGKVPLVDYTFDWRFVKGTTRLSAHSFGTAIDLDTDHGPMYWLWDARDQEPGKATANEDGFRDLHFIPRGKPLMPDKVVLAFERNGFIWGGKWNHYDTMHFEYRPELFERAPVTCAKGP